MGISRERKMEIQKGIAFICVSMLMYMELFLEWLTDKKKVSEILPLLVLGLSITALLFYLKAHGGLKYYGFKWIKNPRSFPVYIPFGIVAFYYLYGGLSVNYTMERCVFRLGISIAMAVLESIIILGFLFRIWSETNPDRSIIISSVLYGLLIAARSPSYCHELEMFCLGTALAAVYALILNKTGSLIPCMMHHALFESLRVFQNEEKMAFVNQHIVMLICFLIAAGYLAAMLQWCKGDEEYYEDEYED